MGLRQLLLRTPKLGGFRSQYAKPATLKINVLEKHFADNATVTKEDLLAKKLVSAVKHGVKILGPGQVTKKLHLVGCEVSKTVRGAIEAAGGSVK